MHFGWKCFKLVFCKPNCHCSSHSTQVRDHFCPRPLHRPHSDHYNGYKKQYDHDQHPWRRKHEEKRKSDGKSQTSCVNFFLFFYYQQIHERTNTNNELILITSSAYLKPDTAFLCATVLTVVQKLLKKHINVLHFCTGWAWPL